MTFAQKFLTYQIKLESGGGGSTSSGLRSTCTMIGSGQPSQMQANIAIYGLPLEKMNQLITFGTQATLIGKNKIKVFAKDGNEPETLIFEGTIQRAFVDGMDQPNVNLKILALGAGWESVMKSEPTSFKNDTDLAQAMQQLAQKMELKFENSLKKPLTVRAGTYLEGAYYQQALELASHFKTEGVQIVVERGVLAIWNDGTPRKGSGANVSYRDGTLVGYPAFNEAGPIFTIYFNPNVVLGSSITVESTIKPACGRWYVDHVEYDLASLVPHGPWFLTAYCTIAS
jgi:hypothetical protein